jgi:hypothetical protein
MQLLTKMLMAAPPIVTLVLAASGGWLWAVGGGILTMVTTVFALRKTNADTRKTEAETRKAHADAQKTEVETYWFDFEKRKEHFAVINKYETTR